MFANSKHKESPMRVLPSVFNRRIYAPDAMFLAQKFGSQTTKLAIAKAIMESAADKAVGHTLRICDNSTALRQPMHSSPAERSGVPDNCLTGQVWNSFEYALHLRHLRLNRSYKFLLWPLGNTCDK